MRGPLAGRVFVLRVAVDAALKAALAHQLLHISFCTLALDVSFCTLALSRPLFQRRAAAAVGTFRQLGAELKWKIQE
jgi:hypothetical protein